MIRKILFGLLLLIIAGVAGLLIFGPAQTEKSMNIVDGKPLPEVSAEALALHKTLTIVDLHSDSLMWDRDISQRADYGQMDLPRLQDGNVALQIFSSVTKTPKDQNYDSNSDETDNITPLVMAQLQPVRTWSSLLERSLYHAGKLDKLVADVEGDAIYVKSSTAVDDLIKRRSNIASWPQRVGGATKRGPLAPTGVMMSVEGLHNLEGRRENLQKLYSAGIRMAGITHFFDNELGGSMHGTVKGGLTPFGREIVRDMENMGMIVDIAHLSHAGVADVIQMARRPVVSSHGGVQATCPQNRNLTDTEIKGVAATGGVIGVGYWEGAVCDTSPAAVAKAIKHIRDLVGIEYAALGSDYDGAVTVRFDTSKLVHVTQALMNEGFSEEEIRAVMGENALRVIRKGLLPFADNPADEGDDEKAAPAA